jgi:hypothetical protein
LLLGKGGGSTKLQLEDKDISSPWYAQELLEGIGFRTEACQHYILKNKEEDFSNKYGFAVIGDPQ